MCCGLSADFFFPPIVDAFAMSFVLFAGSVYVRRRVNCQATSLTPESKPMLNFLITDAVAKGETEFDYGSNENAQRLLIEFNRNCSSMASTYEQDAIGDAIWYLYGCVSGMIHDVLDPSVSSGFGEFYNSMQFLYDDAFATLLPNRRSRGSAPLATACYMLWDMDGIEYLTFSRTADTIRLAEPLIDFGLGHDHAAVQESFLHLLGHQRDSHPDFADPKLAAFLQRRDISSEIRKYALECQTGMIL